MPAIPRRVLLAAFLGVVFATPAFAGPDAAASGPAGEVADAVADAAVDCAREAVVGQAVSEGVRKLGAAGGQMLGRLGLKAPAPAGGPADNPCVPRAVAATGAAEAAPAPAPAAAPPSRFKLPTLNAPRTNSSGRNCGALGAGCADGMNPLVACMNEKDGHLWRVLADTVEAKRDRTPGLSAQQLTDVNADIAAMRRAHAAGASRVEPVDPANPSRHTSWLTNEEYSVAATRASQEINAHTEACNSRHARF